MKTCPVCGEDIAAISSVCPYCESPQPAGGVRRAAGFSLSPIANINVEDGLPTVDEALARLKARLGAAEANGAGLVRVIHGWGSTSGGGGKIRPAVRRWLVGQLECGRFRSVLPGDRYSHTEPEGRALIRRFPDLTSTERQDRHNPGITFVEL